MVDLVWTNSLELVLGTTNVPRGPSDHNVITTSLRIKGTERNIHELIKRNRNKLNIDILRANLANVPQEQLYKIKDIEKANKGLKTTFWKYLTDNVSWE